MRQCLGELREASPACPVAAAELRPGSRRSRRAARRADRGAAALPGSRRSSDQSARPAGLWRAATATRSATTAQAPGARRASSAAKPLSIWVTAAADRDAEQRAVGRRRDQAGTHRGPARSRPRPPPASAARYGDRLGCASAADDERIPAAARPGSRSRRRSRRARPGRRGPRDDPRVGVAAAPQHVARAAARSRARAASARPGAQRGWLRPPTCDSGPITLSDRDGGVPAQLGASPPISTSGSWSTSSAPAPCQRLAETRDRRRESAVRSPGHAGSHPVASASPGRRQSTGCPAG